MKRNGEKGSLEIIVTALLGVLIIVVTIPSLTGLGQTTRDSLDNLAQNIPGYQPDGGGGGAGGGGSGNKDLQQQIQ